MTLALCQSLVSELELLLAGESGTSICILPWQE
jgi:hypothetical protein